MDPVTLAMLTSAVSILGHEYLKGLANEAGKKTWGLVKAIFGWHDDPSPAELPRQVATSLETSPELAVKLWEILKNNQGAGTAAAIVNKIEAEKVINIQTNYGPIQM